MKFKGSDIVKTPDGKSWFYDEKHHQWIEVTESKKMRKSTFVSI